MTRFLLALLIIGLATAAVLSGLLTAAMFLMDIRT